MRSVKEAGTFPYTLSTVCYFEVMQDGTIKHIAHYRKAQFAELVNAYRRALDGLSTIYCVRPGQYMSDLFVIDDLDKFAKAFEIDG